MKRHTRKWKEKELEVIFDKLKKARVIAIADIERFPANLFAKTRKKLHGKAEVRVTKLRVARKAFQKAGFDPEIIDSKLNGSIAIIFSELNAFELYSLLKKNKGEIYAKPGMVLDQDITVSAGDTGLPPGPDLADLKAAGIPVQLQGASIKISNDFVLTKAGEKVTPEAAKALIKLDIKPVSIGLKIVSAFEDNNWFDAKILEINPEKEKQKYVSAYRNALNLALNIAYPTKQTIELLVQKAFTDMKKLSIETNNLNEASIQVLLLKAVSQANSLKPLIKEDLRTEQNEESKKKAREKNKN